MDAILFGLSGVVLEPRRAADCARVERAAGVSDPQRFWAAYEDLRPDYELGRISDGRWWQRVGVSEINTAAVVRADTETRAHANRAVVDCVLGRLDAGVCCGVIDNAPAALATHLRREHRWLDELDAVVFSCDIGVGKPDIAAYRVALDAMGARPATTLYVDCREDWLEAGAQVGMQTVMFTTPADLRGVLNTL